MRLNFIICYMPNGSLPPSEDNNNPIIALKSVYPSVEVGAATVNLPKLIVFVAFNVAVVFAFSVKPPAFSITSITLLFEFKVYMPGIFTSPFISTLYSSIISFVGSSFISFFLNFVLFSFTTLVLLFL